MIETLIFFIGASLLLYVVFGGADYGAGVLELLPVSAELREKQTKTVNDAMGPVWEANHIWLILIVVILFIGFPDIFITLMTALHIPMVALLLGIVVRGCAFTFRHYDPEYEETSQRVYTLIFGASSLWTSIWLGIIVASLNRGLIRDDATTFFDAYIAPWIGLFPILMGIFVLLIFSFLAAVYLIGETRDKALRATFVRRAYLLNILLIIQGALVFAASLREREGLLFQLITRPATALSLIHI